MLFSSIETKNTNSFEYFFKARKLSNPSKLVMLKFMVFLFVPKLAKILGFAAMDLEGGNFFIDLVKKSVEEREKSGKRYNDFIDQVLDVFKGASMVKI